jgi:hypothetical protein
MKDLEWRDHQTNNCDENDLELRSVFVYAVDVHCYRHFHILRQGFATISCTLVPVWLISSGATAVASLFEE